MAHGTCCRCVQKRHFWAYGWTWRRNVALVRLVGVCGRGVAESTLALRLREEKRHGWVDVCMGYLIFFQPRRTKLTKSIHCAGETQFLTLESHACQSKWMKKIFCIGGFCCCKGSKIMGISIWLSGMLWFWSNCFLIFGLVVFSFLLHFSDSNKSICHCISSLFLRFKNLLYFSLLLLPHSVSFCLANSCTTSDFF